MIKRFHSNTFTCITLCLLSACSSEGSQSEKTYQQQYPDFYQIFGNTLDLEDLPNYVNQSNPSYIQKDNTPRQQA